MHIDAPQVDGTQEGMPATARYGIVVAIVDPAYARLTSDFSGPGGAALAPSGSQPRAVPA